MDSLPIQYLHLETAIIPLFLVMVLLTQLARSTEPGYFVANSRRHLMLTLVGFGGVSVAFVGILANVSPLLGAELAAGVTLSMLHPVNALCFFVHLLYLRPWEILTTNPLLLALPRGISLLCFFSWLLYPQLHAKPTPQTLKSLNLLLMFSAWLFISTFFTPNAAENQMDWFSTFSKSIVIFGMCLFFIESKRSIAEFQLSFVFSALALIAVGIYHFKTTGGTASRLESFGMFGNSNDVAAIVVMALPFAVVPAFRKSAHMLSQVLGALFAALSFVVIWYSQSRGAMLGLAAQALTVGIVHTGGKKRLNLLLLAGLLGAGYFGIVKLVHRDVESMEASSESRITYWKTAINMTIRHPIFGVGYNQYPANYDTYTVGNKFEWGLRTAHSSWLLAFAESGLPGGMVFLAFFIMVIKAAWRNRDVWPEQLYAVAGMAVVISFLSHTYVMDIYLLSGLVMATNSLSSQKAST